MRLFKKKKIVTRKQLITLRRMLIKYKGDSKELDNIVIDNDSIESIIYAVPGVEITIFANGHTQTHDTIGIDNDH